mgnify:CR=1 FL=1
MKKLKLIIFLILIVLIISIPELFYWVKDYICAYTPIGFIEANF